MDYKIGEIYLTKEEFDEYVNKIVDSLFNILFVYERCQPTSDFESFFKYVDRLSSEMNGIYYILGLNPFVSISAILADMSKNLYEHDKVKTLAFHCISLVKKAMVVQ